MSKRNPKTKGRLPPVRNPHALPAKTRKAGPILETDKRKRTRSGEPDELDEVEDEDISDDECLMDYGKSKDC